MTRPTFILKRLSELQHGDEFKFNNGSVFYTLHRNKWGDFQGRSVNTGRLTPYLWSGRYVKVKELPVDYSNFDIEWV